MPVMPLSDHRLSWEQRKALHDVLDRRARALRQDIEQSLHRGDAPGIGDPREAADDAAVGNLQVALDVAALERDSTELQEVDEAMQRLADGRAYGSCDDCGAPIAMERLMARPQVRRCTRCQERAERAAPPV